MRPYGIAVLVMLVVFPICTSAFAAEYHVRQDGSGDFTSIQAAIDVAQDGDVIVVHPGTYYENIRFDGKNITLRSLDPEDQEIVASTIIDGGQNSSVVKFDGTEDETCLLSGFTITNGKSYLGGGIYGGGTFAGVRNCTISGNEARASGGGLFFCEGPISNCIVWGNQEAGVPNELYNCSASVAYCCVQGWTGGGEGNISDDPLFVTGPLGDYHLSCRAAGQATDSPCIDAGGGTAQSAGLDKLTTRTDGVPDAGIVDMGSHYWTEAEPGAEVMTYLNQVEFSGGDVLVGYLEFENAGPPALVDIYVGFMLPSGAILYYGSNDMLSAARGPWRSGILLPSDFSWGPGEVLRMTLPEGTRSGSYIFGAGLTPSGETSFISWHNTAFEIQ